MSNKKTLSGKYWLFLFWPFLSLIFSFKDYRAENSKNILWAFCVFLGLTFVVVDEADASRYVEWLKIMANDSDLTFSHFIVKYLYFNGQFRIDFIDPLCQYVISRFTTNGNVLLGLYGLIFGYFYSRNIFLLLDRIKVNLKIEAITFLILFASLVPFWEINGFRFWTATHVFIYGIINFFTLDRPIKGIIFIASSILFHDTYILGLLLFLFYLSINKFRFSLSVILYFYVISIFLENLNFDLIVNLIEDTGLVRKERIGYVDEEYALNELKTIAETNFYVKYKYTLIKILIFGSAIWIYFKRKSLIISNNEILNYFKFGLLFMSIINLLSEVPSMKRFYYIGFHSIIVMLYLFFGTLNFKRRPDWYKVMSLTIVLISVTTKVWIGLLYFSEATLISNPFTFWMFDYSNSINQLIKDILS